MCMGIGNQSDESWERVSLLFSVGGASREKMKESMC